MFFLDAVVGLGNPSDKYSMTRHNIGYMVVDKIAGGSTKNWKPGKGKFYYSVVSLKGHKLYLIRSSTYMNESGLGILDAVNSLDIQPERILVVLDDFSLPYGTIRIRAKGSSGGHKGLESIIYQLNTELIPRIRIGIGPVPDDLDPVDFVLENFSINEQRNLKKIIDISSEAVISCVTRGIEKSMELYNRSFFETPTAKQEEGQK